MREKANYAVKMTFLTRHLGMSHYLTTEPRKRLKACHIAYIGLPISTQDSPQRVRVCDVDILRGKRRPLSRFERR